MRLRVLADGDGEADIHLPAGGDHGVGIEAAVGPHLELSPGPGMAHSPNRLLQEVAGGNGQQGVIAPGTGVDVVAGALLGQPIGLADGRVRSMVRGESPGPAQTVQARASN